MDQLLVCHTLGPQLMKLLGIPEHCTSFELRCAVDEIVTVKCEFHPVRDDGKLDSLGALMGEYQIIPRAPRLPKGFTYDAYGNIYSYVDREGEELTISMAGFDAWMRQRTDRAHAEFLARTSNLPSAT